MIDDCHNYDHWDIMIGYIVRVRTHLKDPQKHSWVEKNMSNMSMRGKNVGITFRHSPHPRESLNEL